MFKKLFILILLLFIVSSCGEEDIIETGDSLTIEEGSDFTIKVPNNWVKITNIDKNLPKSNKGKIELVITSNNLVNGFSNNLLILSDKLDIFTSSKDFSIINNVGSSEYYLNYNKLDSKDFKFLDGEEGYLYIFEAKYNYDTPKLKFLQTSHICNQNKAFLLTIAISTNIRDTSKYEYLLSTFKCNEKEK